MQTMSVPELFRCPIGLDLFTDPVALSTGQTYDRVNIEKWLAYGNLTCPVTMQRLHDTSLVPNHTLRHLIEQWLLANSAVLTVPIQSTDVTLSALKHNLQFRESTTVTKLETLRIIKLLSTESSARQASLVREGFFELLLQVLFQFPMAENTEIIELALDGVLNLSLSPSRDLESVNMLREESNLVRLVFLLEEGNSRVKTKLCCLLEAIASHELCLVLGRRERLLQVLISLLLNKSEFRGASEAALRAICSLCSLEANRNTAIREGAMDGLIAYLSSAIYASRSWNPNVSLALATLEQLLALDVGKRRMSKMENGVMVLVKMVFRVPCDKGSSEHAVGALLLLCNDSAKARRDAINAGVLTQLLLLLQSQSSEQVKSKVRALLKLLRTKWAKEDCELEHTRMQ
ncbi:U-box domain-containing protein 26-like [Curcuma longa]|uniref:U-box domain-containing protein 26-like n=1 Tax=Curcuma longa TaxID=136217 RepID=UPI003D9F62D3